MNDPESTEKETRLHARLVAEAAAGRPEFSRELHDRIMQSIGECRRSSVGARRRVRFHLWAAGAAAAMTVAFSVWLAQGVDPNAPTEQPAPPSMARDGDNRPEPAASPSDDRPTLLAAADPVADEWTALVDATFAGPQWAYLDHDARMAANMVLDHLPFALPVAEVP